MNVRSLACPGLAVVLVVAGSLATGVLPSTTPYQVIAGGGIVAGFALLLYCFRD